MEYQRMLESVADVSEEAADRKRLIDQRNFEKEKLELLVKQNQDQLEQLAVDREHKRQKLEHLTERLKTAEAEKLAAESKERQGELSFRRRTEEVSGLQKKIAIEKEKKEKIVKDTLDRALEAEQTAIANLDRSIHKISIQKLGERRLDEFRHRERSEQDRDRLRSEIDQLTMGLKDERKQNEHATKKIEDLLREREILNRQVIGNDGNLKKISDLISEQNAKIVGEEKISTALLRELEISKHELKNQENRNLEISRQIAAAENKFLEGNKALKEKASASLVLKTEIDYLAKRYLQQKNLYEAVNVDRNMYVKSISDNVSEHNRLKMQFKTLFHQTEQIRDEIVNKDGQLIRDHFERHRLLKSNESIKEAIAKLKTRHESLETINTSQKAEIENLQETISTLKSELGSQQKAVALVIKERDLLSAQLAQRNREMAEVLEKISILQGEIERGADKYRKATDDKDAFVEKTEKVVKELVSLRDKYSIIAETRAEIHALKRQLSTETQRLRALLDLLDQPMNVHRWRGLAGSDPEHAKLLRRVRDLQRMLITRQKNLLKINVDIENKSQFYSELQTKELQRRSVEDLAAQLNELEITVKESRGTVDDLQQKVVAERTQTVETVAERGRLQRELRYVHERFFQSQL